MLQRLNMLFLLGPADWGLLPESAESYAKPVEAFGIVVIFKADLAQPHARTFGTIVGNTLR